MMMLMDLDPGTLGTMLAEGKAQLEQLRQGAPDDHRHRRIDALEERLDQQEQVIRHTLTMLIEWIEEQNEASADGG